MVLWVFLVGAEDKQRWKGTSLFLASHHNSSLETVVETVGGPHAGEVQGVHPSLCWGTPVALPVCNSPELQPKAAVGLAGSSLVCTYSIAQHPVYCHSGHRMTTQVDLPGLNNSPGAAASVVLSKISPLPPIPVGFWAPLITASDLPSIN